jgi:hypothetical protein
MYTSCMSYSCNESEVSYSPSPWSGIPGYAIDEPASEQRAMGMLSYLYGATGELYYQTTENLQSAWTNQYYSGGNGDGTLFYPGLPSGPNAIGGTHPIPLDSIRMKRIRDGREDYEYLHLLDGQGQGAAARSVVEGVFGSPGSAAYSTDVTSDALDGARAELAAKIAGGGSARPNTRILKAPHGRIRRHHAVIKLASNAAAPRFQCRIDSRAWRPCRKTTVLRRLRSGSHVVRARATAAGRRDRTPPKRRFRVVPKHHRKHRHHR